MSRAAVTLAPLAALVVACGAARTPRTALTSVWAERCPFDASARATSTTARARVGAALTYDAATQLALVSDGDNARVSFVRLGAQPAVVAALATGAGPAQSLLVDAQRLFVVERLHNTVSLYDPCTGARTASAVVARDPLAMALAPDARTLYVLSSLGHTLTELDARTLTPRRTLDLARDPHGLAVDARGTRLYVTHLAGAPLSVIDLRAAASAPLEARSHTPSLGPLEAIDTYEHVGGGYYGSGQRSSYSVLVGQIEQRFSQAFALVVDANGRAVVPMVLNRPAQSLASGARSFGGYGGAGARDEAHVEPTDFALAVFDPTRASWAIPYPTRLNTATRGARVRVPMAVAVDPVSSALYVASTGSNTVARVFPTPDGGASIALRETLTAPSALAFTPGGELLVFSQIEHTLEHGPPGARRRIVLGDDPLSPDVALGRRLYFTAYDPALSTAGLACAGCHPQGRDDGLTWLIADEPRQTPSLAGRLVPPFGWRGSQRTLPEAIAQSVRRIGGTGVGWPQINALAAYVSRGMPLAPAPERAPDARENRGRQLFVRARCASCHDPSNDFADGHAYLLGESRMDTPSLHFVGTTAPYFHDGRYETLDALLRDPRSAMGTAYLLGDDERADLAAYLQTL